MERDYIEEALVVGVLLEKALEAIVVRIWAAPVVIRALAEQ